MTLKTSVMNGASSEGLRTASASDLGIEASYRRYLERARQVLDDRVEERLHALVLEGRAKEYR